MMEMIWWLVPAVLLMGIIALAVQTAKLIRRAPLQVIEPISTLIKDWQVARFEPNTETVKKLIKSLGSANLSTNTLMERIILTIGAKIRLRSRATQLTVVSQQPLAPLAERWIVGNDKHQQSIIIGPLSQIIPWIDDDKIDQYHHLSLQAAEHGYLALTLASAFVHSQKRPPTKHTLIGMVLLEPVIDRAQLKAGQPIRFLTVAPLQFALRLYEQLFPDWSHFGLNAVELQTLAPKFAERDLAKAVVIGAADLQARHRVLQSWQQLFNCRYLSVNPEDQDLPSAE